MGSRTDLDLNAAPSQAPLRSRDVLAIAVPMIFSNATVPLVGIVDTAVIGQMNDPALAGGVALGSTIFSLMFWAFGFLRMGTSALTAQAVGAGDATEVSAHLKRALLLALIAGVTLYLIHVPAVLLTLKLIGGSVQVQTATSAYFGVRIVSAPATLANYAIVGWFIGRSRADVAFLLQLFLNLINIAVAVALVIGAGKGIGGAASAAAISDYAAAFAGLILARKHLKAATNRVFARAAFRKMIAVNADIMARTLCLLFAFTFLAAEGARLGDVALAANSVLRALSDLSAYILDGFAFAAEVLTGQAIGAGSPARFWKAVRLTSAWASALAIAVSAAFWLCGSMLIPAMTSAPNVREAAQALLPWAALTPIAGVACFQLDGIFIGATRTADMRNMMAVSLLIFLAAWAVLTPRFGNEGLWASLIVFYFARALTLATRFPSLVRFIAQKASASR